MASAPVSAASASASRVRLRYEKATRQPSCAKARTAAAPMPRAPPVIHTVFLICSLSLSAYTKQRADRPVPIRPLSGKILLVCVRLP